MHFRFPRTASMLVTVCSALVLSTGCGEPSAEGTGGTGGTVGTGGTGGGGGGTGGTGGSGIAVVVPQCVSSAYQIVFRGFVEPLDPLLRYMDTPASERDAAQKPPISSLSELKDVPNVYSRFTWNANDVPGVSDPFDTLITADFVESSGLNPANLDNGIGNSEVVLIPWEMTVAGATTVGAGKLSVVGLGEDTVRVTIVALEEEKGGPNPWYEGGANTCRFEISSFQLQLDLATPGSEPFAVVIGFKTEGSGYGIENGSIIFGEGETASFTGGYKLGSDAPIPFDFVLDYSTDPAAIDGTFGGVQTSCTIDLTTFAVSC